MDMLYGLKKIGVMGGHGDGANAIPAQFATTPILKAYREGTAMRMLSDAIAAIPGIVNLRPEPDDVPWSERAVRARKAGVDLCVELHTNWSVNSAGEPNSNVFLVIIPMYNPIHNTGEQKAMAIQLFKPLADAMGMKFELRTRKGSGEWDYYSFINYCNRERIPYPFIVEHGYHIDYASNESEFRQLIASRYAEIVQAAPEVAPAEDTSEIIYRVQTGEYDTDARALEAVANVEAAGYNAFISRYPRVQVGAFRNKAYAENLLKELQEKGFKSSFLTLFNRKKS
jgi:hypothetical protein